MKEKEINELNREAEVEYLSIRNYFQPSHATLSHLHRRDLRPQLARAGISGSPLRVRALCSEQGRPTTSPSSL